jgi:hypothetical protein
MSDLEAIGDFPMDHASLLAGFLGLSLLMAQGQAGSVGQNLTSSQTAQAAKKQSDVDNGFYNPKEPCPGSRETQETSSFGDYVFRAYRFPNSAGCYEILRDGRRLWSQNGIKFTIGDFEEKKRLPMGTDITGAGEPDLVVAEWTGGAHCCFLYHLFQIGKTFRKIDTIDAGHSDLDAFVNLDGDPALEFKATDWTFAYWRTAFVYSPTVEVILKFLGGKYRFASDLMKSKPPSPNELQQSASAVHELYAYDGDQNVWWQTIWSEVLKLIYSGNAPLARQYLELAWPPERDDKLEVIGNFRKTLERSPYYRDILALNGGHLF